MLPRILGLLLALLFIVSPAGCVNTRSTAQAVPDSIIREPDNSVETHGEVGALYGASASRR